MNKVVIIGGGFGGLSTAFFLKKFATDPLEIHIFDEGHSYINRNCPVTEKKGNCQDCKTCSLLKGIGGAATIRGGKLCGYPAGESVIKMDLRQNMTQHFEQILYDSFDSRLFCNDSLKDIKKENRNMKPYFSKILLKSEMEQLISNILCEINHNIHVHPNSHVYEIERKNGFSIKYLCNGSKVSLVSDYAVIATGRSGIYQMFKLLNELGLAYIKQPVDVGIRMEFKINKSMKPPYNINDPKIKIHKLHLEDTRTFCMCWGGSLVSLPLCGGKIVDGHFGKILSNWANIAIMKRTYPNDISSFKYAMDFTKLFNPKTIPVVQSLAEFLKGKNGKSLIYRKPTLNSTTFDISSVLDKKIHKDIKELIFQIREQVEFDLKETNVYAPAVDRFWPNVECNEYGETQLPNLYVVGDARGIARGYLQAMWSGYIAALHISQKQEKYVTPVSLKK